MSQSQSLFSGAGYIRIVLIALVLIITAGAGLGILAELPGEKPDREVRVVSFEPQGQTEPQTNITISFSNDLVPKDSIDRPVTDMPVVFDPPLAGLARWVGTDVIRIFPDEPLAPATEYTARVKSDRDWVRGNRIKDDAEFVFRTPLLEVEDWSDWAQRSQDNPNFGLFFIEVSFNYEVRTEDFRKRLSIKGTGETSLEKPAYEVAPGDVSLEGFVQAQYDSVYSSYFTVRTAPIELTRFRQTFDIKIEDGLECRNCGEALPREFNNRLEMPAQPTWALRVEQVRARGSQIDIYFSYPVSPSEAEEYISLEPEAEFRISSGYRNLSLHGSFEPGETYDVKIADGLRSEGGAVLDHSFSGRVNIPDRNPSVSFSANGVFLPRAGNRLIELETVNIDTVSIEVEQVYANNLVYYLASTGNSYYGFNIANYGRNLQVETFPLEYEKNSTLVSTFDITDLIGESESGIFRVSARNAAGRWTSDTRQVMLTNIGIASRMSDDGLTVWLNTLDSVRPIAGARVALYARNNQVLDETVSDDQGVATFDGIGRFEEEARPFAVVVENGNDLSYLLFSDCLIDQSDFDVSGRPYLTKGYEAFLYADRGVYRPGETVHLVSIVRGAGCTTPADFPYRLKITDPRGKEVETFLMNDAGEPMATVDFEVDDGAMTGKYVVVAQIGEEETIGRAEFNVEEFMPDRIKTEVKPESARYRAGDSVVFDVIGTFLFGPPAAGHKVSANLTLEPESFRPQGYSKYVFEDRQVSFKRNVIDLGDAELDESGRHVFKRELRQALRAPSTIKGTIWGTVYENGGRGVSNFATLTVDPYPRYIGIKLNLDSYAKVGDSVTAAVIALTPDGHPVSLQDASVKIYQVEYHSMYRRDRQGHGRWVSKRTQSLFDSARVDMTVDGAVVAMVPERYGRWRIVVADAEGGHEAAVEFYASGWGYAPWSMEEPDRIQFDLDRDVYRAGDTALLQARTPFSGKLLLTIERDRVLSYRTIEIPENTAEIPLVIEEDWFPNVYVTGTLIKPASAIESKTPARAFGTVPLLLNKKAKELPLKLSAPVVMKPRQPISIDVKTPGRPNSTVAIAAVDEGILQLTAYEVPDPLSFFHGKKRAAVRAYDIYSFIYPEASESANRLSPPGGRADLFSEQRKRQLNPFSAKRVQPVALWSGLVKTDAEGSATVKMQVPQFNGQLTLLAVAAQADMFGSAVAATKVRDRIVIQESFPRFVSPNDIVEGLVTVFNNLGQEAPIEVSLALDGPAELLEASTTTVVVADGGEGVVRFRFKADLMPGVVKVKITATGGGESNSTEFELPNRPAQPLTSVFGSGVVNDSTPASVMFAGSWVEGTQQYVIKTSSLAAVAFTRNIDFLLRYPYGCIEQTTSRLFPLLYFDNLARFVQPELFGGHGHEYFIREGIDRLLSMQRADRSFSYWPGGSFYHNWSSIYAAHFLVEAKAAGYEIDTDAYEDVLEFLNDMARGRSYEKIKETHRIYAAYVMARAGKLDKKVTNHLMELDASDLPAYSRYQMAGALGLAGEIDAALALVPGQIHPDLSDPEDGGNFSSGVRTNAILMDILLQLAPDHTGIPVLARSLMEQARLGHWYTTQATSFALMSLGKFFEGKGIPDFSGTIEIGDEETIPIDTSATELIRTDLTGKRVTISIDGTGDCYYYWHSSGVSTSPVTPEYQRGIGVVRDYLDANGNPLDLSSVELGTQVVARIRVEAIDQALENVVVNDMLPAGFEIENPRLVNAPQMSWIPSKQSQPQYRDIRDDRMLLFMNVWPSHPKEFYYSLRAVTAGEFKVPAVSAECMYNPLVAGASSSGVLVISGDSADEEEQDK